MFSLQDTHGRFAVGATTFVSPVRPALSIGSAKLRSKQQAPALQLEEVAFTAYYPANVSSGRLRKGIDWLIRPVKASLYGYARFAQLPLWVLWPVVHAFGRFLNIPVCPDAPLLQPDATGTPWPLVIFSHGLGGSRTAYSQICSRLAASGKVVLAIEHRDGSGHACSSYTWDSKGRTKPRSILYLQEEDVTWDSSEHKDPNSDNKMPLRIDQLLLRQHELYLSYSMFSRLVDGDTSLEIKTIDGADVGWTSWSSVDSASKAKPVNTDSDIVLAGHSFGGCTVLSFISEPSPSPEYHHIPITKCLIYDPWLEPIPSPGPVPLTPPEGHSLPRMLIINSEPFTLWKDHFARLQSIAQASEGTLITLLRARHAAFSDFPLLPLVRTKSAQKFIDIVADVSIAFLDSEEQFKEKLETMETRKMEVEIIGKRKDGRPKRRLVGTLGEIIVH